MTDSFHQPDSRAPGELDGMSGSNAPIPFRRRSTDEFRGAPDAPPSRGRGDSQLHMLDLGTLELVAGPFRTFREVGRFHQAVAQIDGVRSVQPRQLGRGALQLRLECSPTLDLATALSEIYDVPFRVVSHTAYRLEIVFVGVAADMTREGNGA